MKNNYEIRGDVTAIYLYSKKRGQLETIINTAYLDKMELYPNKWYARWENSSKTFYVIGYIRENGVYKSIQIHRYIMDAPKEVVVDHKNHDTLDNRCENLRLATKSENAQNRKGSDRDSKSGVRGVYWKKASGKWASNIKINGKGIYLGLFTNLIDAECAVKEARTKYMPFSQEAMAN